MTEIFRVIHQTETIEVDSQKSESGKLSKCTIILQEMGGKYVNQYAAVMLGQQACTRYLAGDMVAASLRFQTREHNGQYYQDIVLQDIYKLNN